MRRILLVEDNAADEKLTLRALRKVNLANQVDVVRDGQQALDYLFSEGEFIDRKEARLPVVVLLDVNLPRVSGLDVLATIRAKELTKTLPVVMLTSSAEDRDRVQSYASGANSYVQKPVVFEEFAETVGRLGVYWYLTNEPP
jgi:CheY-like chemotaxis protein